VLLQHSHAHRALEIADKVYLLASGEIKFAGVPQHLLERKDLLSLYLGM
jgi:ABC-type branched-subunit amino acid transport system ATPase component